MKTSKDRYLEQITRATQGPNPWGKRHLNRFKTENGIKYQLHATRGWKKIGRVKK